MHTRHIVSIAFFLCVIGCASHPVATDLTVINTYPGQFKNRRIEITGPVMENSPPQGDEYRTWTFIIGSPDTHRILVSEEGYNPSTIEKAYRLVEQARKAADEVTVTGTLRVGPYRELEAGMEVAMDSVRYRDIQINTDKGPFVSDRYYPYYGSVFIHYGHYHHHY